MRITGRDRTAGGAVRSLRRAGGNVSPLGVVQLIAGLTSGALADWAPETPRARPDAAPVRSSAYRFFSSAFSMTSRET